MMKFLEGNEKKEESQEELKILATKVEVLNQMLTQANTGFNPQMEKSFIDINNKIVYLYKYMQKQQADLLQVLETNRSDTKKLFEEALVMLSNISKDQNATPKQNKDLEDIKKSIELLGNKISFLNSVVQDYARQKQTLKEVVHETDEVVKDLDKNFRKKDKVKSQNAPTKTSSKHRPSPGSSPPR
jgi:hypothetical protein